MMIGSSQAAPTVTVYRVDTNPQVTTAVAAFATYGYDMLGMKVTAKVTGGGSETREWQALPGGDYGVAGNGWRLTENGHTFFDNWNTVTSTIGLDSIYIDAGAGDTMFDTLSGADYTPGSENGTPFRLEAFAGYDGDIDVTYSGPISLTGETFQGDLYRYMLIDFSETFTGSIEFRADTDNAAFPNDINPTVPAPGALLMASLGTGLAGYLRKRRSV